MTKQERAIKARAHYEDIKTRLAANTKLSIERTYVYSPDSFTQHESGNQKPAFTLTDMDSVSCLFNLSNNGRTAILNYASYKNPGGFFLGGSPAQEEALCHESNLYPILLAFDGTYYAWNRQRLNKALYLNRALYSPSVVFERNDKQKEADIITCAAPNFRTAHRYQSVSKSENDRVLENRIHFMYQIAEENGVENLVAGAWGCGVFMQDPYTVATLLIGAARNYNIPNIYFAIPDRNSQNFRAFLKAGKECINS